MKMKKLLSTLLFVMAFGLTQAQVVIQQVRETGFIELRNLGNATVDVSSYWLCDFPAYTQLNDTDITVVSGNLNLEPNATVAISGFDFIDSADGELGLYATGNFGSTAAIRDYIQWGSANHQRAGVAASAGVWSDANATIPAFAATSGLVYDGTGNSPSDYTEELCNVVAADITINTSNLNATTSVAEDGLSAVICIDDLADDITIDVAEGSVGAFEGFIITDATTNEILASPGATPYDLNGTGSGSCDIRYVRFEGILNGNVIGNTLDDLEGCFALSNPVRIIREAADAGTIAIDIEATGNPNNTTSIAEDGLSAVICIDNVGDPLVVTHDNPGAENLSYRYVITNEDASEILNITNSSSIDLSVAGTGTCQIWGWSYRGLADNGASFMGGPLSALRAVETCSDVSTMAITVIREAADAGTIAIDIDATGNPNNTTSIAEDGLSAVICIDNVGDPLVVTHDNPGAENLSYRYVITNEDASEILNITNSSSIDLSVAGTGTCQIWGWSYRGLADNGASFMGGPLSALRAVETCSDVSTMAITVIREAADAGTIAIDIDATGNPNNTTSIAEDGLSAVICIDNVGDPLVVTHDNPGAENLSYRYVITNEDASEILNITNSNSIDLSVAGTGTCQIWGWSYRGLADNGASFMGGPLSALRAVETCSDVSTMAITVIREAADAGTIAIDIDATGNPNNTTSIAEDGLSAVICIDNVGDPLVVTHDNPGAENLSYRYVITNEDASEILNITNSSSIDLSVAGTGTCQIWGWSYRGLADNGASFMGGPLSALRAVETCSDVSTMAITVIREAADAGTIAIDIDATGNPNNTTSIAEDGLSAVICIDNVGDPLVVTHDNPGAENLSYRYVITNEDASEILNITNSNSIDLSVAGTGTCQIWGWSYRGLADNGASFMGGPLSALRAVETCSDVSTMAITVIREAADAGTIAIDVENTSGANGTTIIENATSAQIITGDAIANPIIVTHDNPGATNLSYRYVITNEDASEILNITNSSVIDLEGVFAGTCQIWGWSYRGLADNGASFMGGPLSALRAVETCSDVSTMAITVVRNAAAPITDFTATLTGTQENPVALTTAYGSISATLNENVLTVTGSFSGLTSDFDATVAGGAHIHQAIAGRNGGVELLLATTVSGDLRSGTYEAVNNTFMLTEAQLAALNARELYVNIHSVAFPGGELRGQILPTVDQYLQTNLLGSNEVPSISSAASGNLVMELDGNQLTVSGSFDDLSGDIAVELAGGAHIHDAEAGRNGAVSIVLNLTADEDNRGAVLEAVNNSFTLTDAQVALLMTQGNYVNVHSTAFMPGELRGQITPLAAAVFRAELTGAQEVPAINTDATGRLVITHDGFGTITVSGSFNNLSSDLNTELAGGIHLHPGIAGTNAGVDFILNPTVAADNRNAVLLPADNTFTLSPEQIEQLFSRGYYVNVHSLNFAPGELRGQVLPLANTYLGTNLSGANEVQPVITQAVGNLQFELTGDQLTVTGGFSGLEGDFDASIAGGSHLHIADAANNGDVTIILNATVASDLRSGVYNAADNTFTIDELQRAALLGGTIYVNIHTTAHASGELRGQVLRDDNAFPTAAAIESPENDSTIVISSEDETPIEVTWTAATDRNDDLLVYTFQLATDATFETLLVNDKVGTALSFVTDKASASALLESAGIANGDTVVLYHRVLASDGSVFTPSEAFTITLTRDTTLNVNTFGEATTFSVFPNPASDVLTINSNSNSQNVNIQLFDITGKQLYAKALDMSNAVERVNISALEQGVYLLSINDIDSGKTITKRIVKR